MDFSIDRQNQNRKRPDRRSGVAAVELAVCLPILLLLFVGMIETCTMIFLKQSLAIAAYEGMHTALEAEADAADVEATCNTILTQRRVTGSNVVCDPGNFETLAPGSFFTVRVSAPRLAIHCFHCTSLETSTLRPK